MAGAGFAKGADGCDARHAANAVTMARNNPAADMALMLCSLVAFLKALPSTGTTVVTLCARPSPRGDYDRFGRGLRRPRGEFPKSVRRQFWSRVRCQQGL